MENLSTVLIKNTSHVVGYKNGGHYLIKNGQIVYKGNEIIYVGKKFEGQVDEVVDAKGGLVIPGFVNVHAHMGTGPVDKGFIEDCGTPNLYMTTLYEYNRGIKGLAIEDLLKVMDFSLAEMIPKGSTTIQELGKATDEMVQKIGESGVRAYIGMHSCPGTAKTYDGKSVVNSEPDLKYGYSQLEKNVLLKEKFDGKYHDRVHITLFPGEDECTPPEFLKEVRHLADLHKMKITIHTGQSVQEYNYIVEKYGVTPAQYLVDNGICGPDVFWTHYYLKSGHHLNPRKMPGELELMAETKTNLVHCPWVVGRRGYAMESLQQYLEKGINVVLGTDTFPQDMLYEMRAASVICKIMEGGDPFAASAKTIFDMATLGGAKALGREDLGRLAPGAKADIVIFDTKNMDFLPYRDPIKILVYTARSVYIDRVIVDGNTLVANGKNLRVSEQEYEKLYEQLQDVATRKWAAIHEQDWAGRSIEEMSPLSYPEE